MPENTDNKIGLDHEAESTEGAHPFDHLAEIEAKFPGMNPEQIKQILCMATGCSPESANTYHSMFNSVPRGHPGEEPVQLSRNTYQSEQEEKAVKLSRTYRPPEEVVKLAAYKNPMEHQGQGLGLKPGPFGPTAPVQPVGGVVPPHVQEAALGSNSHDIMHKAIAAARAKAKRPQTPGILGQHAPGSQADPVIRLAKKVAPVQATMVDQANPSAVKSLPAGPAKPFDTRTLSPNNDEHTGIGMEHTRPHTFLHGMLHSIKDWAVKHGRDALGLAAHGAQSRKPGDLAKVGRLLPDDHWAKSHDWKNEEQNQHTDDWVENHAKSLINTKDERTANLTHAKFWDMMHKQFGANGTNSKKDEFLRQLQNERTKSYQDKTNPAVSHLRGLSPQSIQNHMQASLERIKNKHQDQAHWKGMSPKIGEAA